jgi:5-(carboxyamino)imidazole ribonucleotide mutase
MSNQGNSVVAIVMGSDSDWPVMQDAATVLDECGISYDVDVISAHRTPDEMLAFAHTAADKGYKVIIAGAGGAAHLPGMIASATTLPVIGVPVPLKVLDGMDSLLSIVQMPAGIPVATVGVGNSKNAGLLAARILGTSDVAVSIKVEKMMQDARTTSLEKGKKLNAQRNHKTGF